MKAKILIPLCLALFFCVEVYAEGEQEIKRGLFPFMAFLYYPDDTVLDGSGARFLRSAVLVRPDWLISSAIGPNIIDNEPTGFPRKTLIARVGAVSIDANFTLNEDEDEQEREVIQVVRPYNHSSTQWWHTDISLMKTLLPFNITPVVSATSLLNRRENVEKSCIILVYARKDGNWTDDRYLMQLTVELLQPFTVANCGHRFVEKTMICAADSDENKNAAYDPNFCQGNSGGPLVCDGGVVGTQTYINNDCKQPHLYQLLSAWDNFISCGTEDKCHEEECSKICDVTNKDSPTSLRATSTVEEVTTEDTTIVSEAVDIMSTTFDNVDSDSERLTPTMTSQDLTTIKLSNADLISAEVTSIEVTELELTSVTTQSTTNRPITDETLKEYATCAKEEVTERKWPNEKPNSRKSMDQNDTENSERNANMEAQQQDIHVVKHISNGGQTNQLNYSFIFGYIILALFDCII